MRPRRAGPGRSRELPLKFRTVTVNGPCTVNASGGCAPCRSDGWSARLIVRGEQPRRLPVRAGAAGAGPGPGRGSHHDPAAVGCGEPGRLYALDPASLLITSHYHDGLDVFPADWLANEYYQDDVNELADAATS